MTGPPLPAPRGHAPARRELSGLDGAHRSDGRKPSQSDGANNASTARTLESRPDGKPCKALKKGPMSPAGRSICVDERPIRAMNGRRLQPRGGLFARFETR
jgi:hypothetical protein